MISGSSSVEAVLPGNTAAMWSAAEAVGGGAGAAQAVASAWQGMALPGWQGRAGNNWASFTPREASRLGYAPPAFARVAAALMRHQTAFVAARAEIEAAIQSAATAERVTTTALQQHRDATRAAAQAMPGTRAAVVPAFSDPGAASLSAAQSRAEIAIAAFQRTGDEVTAEIRAATVTATEQHPGISVWDQIFEGPGRFVEGFILQAVDTVIGTWELLPFPYMIDNLIDHDGKPWWEQLGTVWGGIIHGIVTDPAGAVEAMWREYIAADHWDGYVGQGIGRVTVNAALTFAGGLGAVGKLKSLRGGARAAATQTNRIASLLDGSAGVSLQGERVLINGVDKMSVNELQKLYDRSVHNMDAKQVTLGKFKVNDPKSYEQVAQARGDAHFNLKGTGWSDAKKQYGVTDDQLYELLNRPFLKEIAEKGLPVRFTVDPRGQQGALGQEYQFLNEHGFKMDDSTWTMYPRKVR